MPYSYVWHIKSIYPTYFQVNTVINFKLIGEMCRDMQLLWLLVSVVTLILYMFKRNGKLLHFLRFLTINCVTTGARELNKIFQISLDSFNSKPQTQSPR